jgi:hypothetical protein
MNDEPNGRQRLHTAFVSDRCLTSPNLGQKQRYNKQAPTSLCRHQPVLHQAQCGRSEQGRHPASVASQAPNNARSCCCSSFPLADPPAVLQLPLHLTRHIILSTFCCIGLQVRAVLHKLVCSDRSLLLFAPEHAIRRAAVFIIRQPWFENLVMLVILANIACLAADDPLCQPDDCHHRKGCCRQIQVRRIHSHSYRGAPYVFDSSSLGHVQTTCGLSRGCSTGPHGRARTPKHHLNPSHAADAIHPVLPRTQTLPWQPAVCHLRLSPLCAPQSTVAEHAALQLGQPRTAQSVISTRFGHRCKMPSLD